MSSAFLANNLSTPNSTGPLVFRTLDVNQDPSAFPNQIYYDEISTEEKCDKISCLILGGLFCIPALIMTPLSCWGFWTAQGAIQSASNVGCLVCPVVLSNSSFCVGFAIYVKNKTNGQLISQRLNNGSLVQLFNLAEEYNTLNKADTSASEINRDYVYKYFEQLCGNNFFIPSTFEEIMKFYDRLEPIYTDIKGLKQSIRSWDPKPANEATAKMNKYLAQINVIEMDWKLFKERKDLFPLYVPTDKPN